MSDITKKDIDNLADIIWWIKGYHAAGEDGYVNCDFKDDHIESLRKAKINLQEILDDRNTPTGHLLKNEKEKP